MSSICVCACVCVALGRSGAEVKPYVSGFKSEPQLAGSTDAASRKERKTKTLPHEGG